MGERKIRERERGKREKITNTKKFMGFYLVVRQSTVVLQSGYRENESMAAKSVNLANLVRCTLEISAAH